jgi:hypothetical protein
MIMVSTDHGLLHVSKNPEAFNKRLAVANPRNLKDVRKTMKELRRKVDKLLASGQPPQRLWVVVDNLSHLQTRLMKEARKVQVEGSARTGRGTMDTEYQREMTTDVDYGVNLGHMVEIADELDTLNCNVAILCLEKAEYGKDRKTTGKMLPSLSGQPAVRFTGDADVILHMKKDKAGARYFENKGDRSGLLADVEPADLAYIVSKMHGKHAPVAALPAPEPEDNAPIETSPEAATESDATEPTNTSAVTATA